MSQVRRGIVLAFLTGISLKLVTTFLVPAYQLQGQARLPCNTCTPHGYNAGCFNPQQTKRIISFTLYKMPDSPEPRSADTVGMLQNLRLMRLIYPGWRMRIKMRSVRTRQSDSKFASET